MKRGKFIIAATLAVSTFMLAGVTPAAANNGRGNGSGNQSTYKPSPHGYKPSPHGYAPGTHGNFSNNGRGQGRSRIRGNGKSRRF